MPSLDPMLATYLFDVVMIAAFAATLYGVLRNR